MNCLPSLIPSIPPRLAAVLEPVPSVFGRTTQHGETALCIQPPTNYYPAIIDDAQEAILRITARLAPFSCDEDHYSTAQTFLDSFNCAVRNPLDEAALDARVGFTVQATKLVPAAAWSENALRAGLQSFRFFPAVAEVHALLEAEIQPVRDIISRLKIIIIKSRYGS